MLAIALVLPPPSPARSTAQRFEPAPHFVKGATLRYSIDSRTDSNEHTTTPIINPEGATQYQQSTSIVVRLDVLEVQPGGPDSPPAIHFRATFEQARADSQADAYAPAAAALDDGIDQLEGRSFDLTVAGADARGVEGLEKIAANREVASRVLSWVRLLCLPSTVPAAGIVVGQKWSDERALTDMPLTGLFWRNDSTYLRNEPCAVSAPKSSTGAFALGDCAVLLTRFTIVRHGSDRDDRTPDSYLHNGLRTSGKWTGSGESLESISLGSGWLVSSTQTATQDMDYQIVSASSGSRIHNVGRTTTQTQITLLLSP
ncbi:MAG TPA: hypothetical protein VEJ67_09980 [Candidatus Cybelea sp.]|nr:hypothetical protein [Candidatus Cybelea sp.]